MDENGYTQRIRRDPNKSYATEEFMQWRFGEHKPPVVQQFIPQPVYESEILV